MHSREGKGLTLGHPGTVWRPVLPTPAQSSFRSSSLPCLAPSCPDPRSLAPPGQRRGGTDPGACEGPLARPFTAALQAAPLGPAEDGPGNVLRLCLRPCGRCVGPSGGTWGRRLGPLPANAGTVGLDHVHPPALGVSLGFPEGVS